MLSLNESSALSQELVLPIIEELIDRVMTAEPIMDKTTPGKKGFINFLNQIIDSRTVERENSKDTIAIHSFLCESK